MFMNTSKRPATTYSTSVFSELSQIQKILISLLGFLAFSVIVFWVWQLKMQIERPFQPAGNSSADGAVVTDSDAILQDNDTDKDGLSDYDEIYTYKTSPYLEDSDSDGLTDQQEVAAGKDPNCPEGANCGLEDMILPVATGTPLVDDTPAEEVSGSGQDVQKILAGDMDGAGLRQLLISTGSATAADLEGISDEELLASYQEALKNQDQ